MPNLPKRLVVPYKVEIKEPFLKKGGLRKNVSDWFEGYDSTVVGGPFTRIDWEDINLGSIEQVKDYLLSTGWVPTEWNYKDGQKTSPKLTEDSYESIKGGFGEDITNRILYRHRRSQIEGWITSFRKDHRITAGANTCGTNTGRFRHFGVVNVPKAKDYIFYGKEMRSLFCASPGRKFVGHDASGLELRMLAHYMNDEDYINEVINGDLHARNQEAAGLPTRDDAKTFIYAFLYGAGNDKIGAIVGGDASDGESLKRQFLSATPSLKRLITNVRKASKKGYLKGLDGRKIWMRRNEYGEVMQHKALNTLLQSAGAVVMKESSILLNQSVKKHTLDVLKVIDMHDESQADVALKDVEKYMELAEQSIVLAGEHFNLKCPLAAKAKVGDNWAMTH
jgi:DNA polymerase I-like protein with 3'-5' exonuclease and polymerase domains